MAWGEGGIWEPDNGGESASSGTGEVNFELAVEGSELVGVVQIHIDQNDTFEQIAQKLATEWNARQPLNLHGPQLFGNVFAVASEQTTMFYPTGDLAASDGKGVPLHPVVRMGVTFPGQERKPLPQIGAFEIWEAGSTKLTRVEQ